MLKKKTLVCFLNICTVILRPCIWYKNKKVRIVIVNIIVYRRDRPINVICPAICNRNILIDNADSFNLFFLSLNNINIIIIECKEFT